MMTPPPSGSLVRTADKPLRQVANVRELLVNRQAQEQLAKVAARHLNPERMMRVMANALRATPALAECEPMSLLGALMQCATLGLEPNTPLGHAYLIPFGKSVTLVVGYKGLADMARRSGLVVSLHSDVVYSDDELWSYEYGSGMHLRHKPGPREGRKVAAYCYVKLRDGEAFVVLPWPEVMRVRDLSQGYRRAVAKGDKTAPWVAHEDAMARKTALRALANRGEMPISVEFAQALEVDEAPVDFGRLAQHPEDGPVIEAQAAPPPEPEPDRQPEPEPEAPPRARRTRNARAAEPPPPEDEPDPDALAHLASAYDAILADAMDAGAARAREANAAMIATMRRLDPEMHARLEEELDAFERAEEDL